MDNDCSVEKDNTTAKIAELLNYIGSHGYKHHKITYHPVYICKILQFTYAKYCKTLNGFDLKGDSSDIYQ